MIGASCTKMVISGLIYEIVRHTNYYDTPKNCLFRGILNYVRHHNDF